MKTIYTDTPEEIKPGFKLKPDCRILMFCGSGYSFGEYFKPVITELCKDCQIEFLQADYCLTEPTLKSLEYFSEQEFFSYQIVHIFSQNDSTFSYHRQISRLLKELEKKTFDLLIVSTDFNLVDRYLINLAKAKGIRIIIVHANLMNTDTLYIHRNKKGLKDHIPLPHEFRGRINKLKSSPHKLKFIFSYIFKQITSFPRKVRLSLSGVANRYLWPAIFIRTIFPENKYDRFHFTCGRGDIVICYDPTDIEALKTVIPAVKRVYLARHPSSLYCRPLSEGVPKKLLVLLTSYSTELTGKQFDFWVECIRSIVEKTGLGQIDMRFHPRTDKKLTWPDKLIKAVSGFGPKVTVASNSKVSLAESAGDYSGIIGTLSGSLRTARAASQGFVIGLLKAGCDSLSLLDEDWMLGSSEGIIWISKPQELKDEHFKPVPPVGADRPKAAELIKKFLNEKKH